MKRNTLMGLLVALLTVSGCHLLVDTAVPTVIVRLSDPSPFAGTRVKILAAATDNILIKRVEFFINETPLGTDTRAPFEIFVPKHLLTEGLKIFKAIAFDTSGNKSENQIEAAVRKIEIKEPPINTDLPSETTVDFIVRLKNMKVLGKSTDEIDDALEIAKLMKVQFRSFDDSIEDDKTFFNIQSLGNVDPLILNSVSFASKDQILSGQNLIGSKIYFLIDLIERDGTGFLNNTLNPFEISEFFIDIGELLNSTEDIPFIVPPIILINDVGDSIEINFEIFRNQ
jgi:Bacterial Ig domain